MIPQLQTLDQQQQQQHQAEVYQKSKSLGPAQIFMRDTKGKLPKPVFMPFLIYKEVIEPNTNKRRMRNSNRNAGLQVSTHQDYMKSFVKVPMPKTHNQAREESKRGCFHNAPQEITE